MEQNEKPIVSVKKHIQELGSGAAVIADPLLGNQLMTKYAEMYSLPLEAAKRFYNREKDNFGKLISQSPELQACTPMSVYLAFGKVMSLNLSFDNGRAPLIYLIPGNRNIGTRENPKWIKEVVAQPSPEGEKEARIHTGVLKKVGHPVIVHEGDKFRKYLDQETGQIKVEFEEAENPSTKIKAGFIRLEEPDGTVVYKTFTDTDIKTWRDASAKKNKGNPNALYTAGIDGQIQEAFFKGKILTHCFKGYKQINLGEIPAGFVPDTQAAKAINPSMVDETLDDYEDVTNDPAPTEEQDEFTQAVNEPAEIKASIKVDTTGDDDDLFNNN